MGTKLTEGIGYFGKMPSHGDFVTRGLPRSFIDPWDLWMRAGITKSRQQLGDSWLSHYLTAPIYQFALSPDLCGEQSWAGILMPSVDSVGRYYSLVISAPCDADLNPISLMIEKRGWFSSLEQLALTCLNDDFDLEKFHQALQTKQLQTSQSTLVDRDPVCFTDLPKYGDWWFDADTDDFSGKDQKSLDCLISKFGNAYSVWATIGSAQIEPVRLICKGLPASERIAAMLDGNWRKWGWSCNAHHQY